MPTKITSRKTYGKKRTYRKKPNRAVSVAVKKYVRRTMPKVEMKQLWYHHNEVTLNTLAQGYVAYGPNIIQGQASWNRQGNIVNVSGLHLKGILNNNGASENYARMLIVGFDGVKNTSPTDNLFRGDQVGTTVGIAAVNGLDGIYFPINKIDFKVYRDRVFKLGGSAASSPTSNTKMFTEFVKFNGRKVEYKGATTGFGNQSWIYAVIWIVAEGPDDTAGGQAVELSMMERLYYKDA